MNINLTILGQAIMFVLFVWFCMKYIWPPLNQMIEKRQKEIADGLTAADQALKELDIAKKQVEGMLLKAKVDAQAIIDEANKRKLMLIEQAKDEAINEKNNILERAKSEIAMLERHVKDELRHQVALLTITGAQKIIQRSVDEAANADIIDEVIAKL